VTSTLYSSWFSYLSPFRVCLFVGVITSSVGEIRIRAKLSQTSKKM
jgi:hypothetical protein